MAAEKRPSAAFLIFALSDWSYRISSLTGDFLPGLGGKACNVGGSCSKVKKITFKTYRD